MTLFQKLSDSLAEVENKTTSLSEFYMLLWKSSALLRSEQFQEILSKAALIPDKSAQAKCWYAFSEGCMYTFFPSLGNAFEKLSESIELFRKINDTQGEG